MDRKLLLTIIEKYQGGPVGVNTLAAALAEEQDAIEEIYEPFLIQIGFLNRTRADGWRRSWRTNISGSLPIENKVLYSRKLAVGE